MDSPSEDLLMVRNRLRHSLRILYEQIERAQRRIDVLPDDVLLDIFDFYVNTSPLRWYKGKMGIQAWQLLVHVCRRWRSLVFQSPRRLNLRLVCTTQTPAKDTLDVWPALPLLVKGSMALSGTDNVVAALGQSKRVFQIDLLDLASWQLEKVVAAMQVKFPKLTVMRLSSRLGTPSVIPVPVSFLGGLAQRLRTFELDGIPFPGLPKVLGSATHLVHLRLDNVPRSGYISPEEMAALLSVLSNLRELSLQFQSPESRPDWQSRSLPPPERSILPALQRLDFKGVTEYIEELVIRIDAPRLRILRITFFNQIDFDCPRLAQFIDRTPTLKPLDQALVQFDDSTASVRRYGTSSLSTSLLEIEISCRDPDWQLSSIEQICNSWHPLSTVGDLYIERSFFTKLWNNDAIENTLWLQLLLPFTAVNNLYLSQDLAPGIEAALEELAGGRITGVLPSLQNILVKELEASGSFQENIERFVAARQLSERPVAIFNWD